MSELDDLIVQADGVMVRGRHVERICRGETMLRDSVVNVSPAQTVVGTGQWVEVRRNLHKNPLVASAAGFFETSSQASLSYTGTAVRYTLGITGAIALGMDTALGGGIASTVIVRARANRTLSARMRLRRAASTVNTEAITLTSEWQWFVHQAVSGTEFTSAVGIVLLNDAGHVPGDWIEIDRALVAESTVGEFFAPGVPSPDPDLRARWLGPVNASESVLEGQLVEGVHGARTVTLKIEREPSLLRARVYMSGVLQSAAQTAALGMVRWYRDGVPDGTGATYTNLGGDAVISARLEF